MRDSDWLNKPIMIEGVTYPPEVFRSGSPPDFAKKSTFHAILFRLISDWYSDAKSIDILTSGSTGIPRKMQADKRLMVNSVAYTRAFFDLKEGDTALLTLPLYYIAGTLMVIRAIVIGMNLYPIPPCGRPLNHSNVPFTLASMTPLQVYNSLIHDEDREQLTTIKNLIVVGGGIDPKLEDALKHLPNNIYSTYGMAETLTHIAMRRINHPGCSDRYTPFEHVTLSTDHEGGLIIKAPLVSRETLYTNDVAQIFEDGSFQILGRKDNVINSAGIKIVTEKVEQTLSTVIEGLYAISSIPDPKFGNAVVLVTEEDVDPQKVADVLPPYHRPKFIIKHPIPLTATGKINRAQLKAMLTGSGRGFDKK
jgi:O-succinylbenzoic acid--CoA ligase